MAMPNVVSEKKYLTKEDCMEKVKGYKSHKGLKMTDEEVFNHHIESILGLCEDRLKQNVVVSHLEPNKDDLLKKALDEGKDFIITASSLLGDLNTLTNMYMIRERIEQGPRFSGIDIEETYTDDNLVFYSSLCFKKKD